MGDCLDLFQLIPESYVDLIITDPPYGVDFKGGLYNDSKESVFENVVSWMKEMHRVLKDAAHCYIFVPTLEIDKWIAAFRQFFEFKNVLATQTFLTNQTSSIKNNFSFDLQLLLFGSKGKAHDFNKVDWIPTSGSWLRDKRNKNPKKFTYEYPSYIYYDLYRSNTKPNNIVKRIHPNEKNPELIANFIKISSNVNDLVLDPFAGSGSTAVAAWNSNRRYVAFEKDETYCRAAQKRLKTLLNQQKMTDFL